MGFRFRKSIKLGGGVRLNLSARGIGMSAGIKGASVSVGPRGVYANASLPGTGISYQQKLSGTGRTRTQNSGRPTEIDSELTRYARSLDDELGALLTVHLDTPAPDTIIAFVEEPFSEAEPVLPTARRSGLVGLIFKSYEKYVERVNQQKLLEFQEKHSIWALKKKQHVTNENNRRELIENLRFTEPASMESFLADVLNTVSWPKETDVNFQLVGTDCVFLDVDLPEIEDMPMHEVKATARGKIKIKGRSEIQRRKDYMFHIHAVGFRLIGEVFVALPTINTVTLSVYSQRVDKSDGHIKDEYLYSLRVGRDRWSSVNFLNLENLDVIECLGAFDLRRNMTKTGIFKPIEPFQVTE